MESFTLLLSSYFSAHTHPVNKTLHYIGIPLILFSLLLFFSWIHITMSGIFDIQMSWLFAISLTIFYFLLNVQFAVAFAVILLPLIVIANTITIHWVSFFIFCIFFSAGWILNFIGHVIEGQQPAFIANPKLILMAPLFILAELAFKRGYCLELQKRVVFERTPN